MLPYGEFKLKLQHNNYQNNSGSLLEDFTKPFDMLPKYFTEICNIRLSSLISN
jgi:hypothetical protein